MKHDPFEYNGNMTRMEMFWRVLLLAILIAVSVLDLFYWRP